MDERTYAGFWIRTGASIIDSILILIVVGPLLTMIYGQEYWMDSALVKGPMDAVVNYVLPAFAIVAFWIAKSATPGKMATNLTIVDAKTGGRPSKGQFVIRYLGYYVAAIPLLLGLIWVGIDKRKQGWHDKLAGTVVLKDNASQPVRFDNDS
jgi:uncharacterized RDD family membrane protein YckC